MATSVLYGDGIHRAIASGDLKEMRAVAKAAEKHLDKFGDVQTSLALLKIEIARQSRKGRT